MRKVATRRDDLRLATTRPSACSCCESFVSWGFFFWAWYAWQPYFLELYGEDAIWLVRA